MPTDRDLRRAAGLPPRPATPLSPEQRRANLRLGWILGGLAIAIFVAFILKSVWLAA